MSPRARVDVRQQRRRHFPAILALRVAVAAIALGSIAWQVGEGRRARAVGEPTHLYVDPGQGFALRLPAGMRVDKSLGHVATVIADERTRVEVFHDLLKDAKAANYVYYKKRPILIGVDPVRLELDESTRTARWPVHQVRWTRPPLAHVPGDRHHYATFDFEAGEREVWSVHVKTSDPTWIPEHADDIVDSFAVFQPREKARVAPRSAAARAAPLSPRAREAFVRLFGSDRQTWGIYEPSAFASYDALHELERRLGHRFEVLLEYIMIDDTNTTEMLERARGEGRTLELTLQLAPPDGAHSAAFVYEVLDGRHDERLREIAREIASFGDPVLFRLNNEMNGDWVVYSGYWTSQDAEIFKATWRHVFRLFQDEGATNAIWVWNPHDRHFPPFNYNHMLLYDPGPQYWDVLGLTGYNNGTYYPNETWRSFDEIYRPIYEEYAAIFPGKPFMITEFASSTIGGDKAAWIRDTMSRLQDYPNVKVAVWWNGVDMDGAVPARPYRLSGDDVLAAFADGLARYR